MNLRPTISRLVALVCFGSGLLDLWSLIGPGLPHRLALLERALPLGVTPVARSLTLVIGFALIVTALNILRRKKRAFQIALFLAALSVLSHLTKGLDYEEASVSLGVVLILLLTRKHFTVKSSIPIIARGVLRLSTGLVTAVAYGVVGFWYLDRHHFGIDFHVNESVRETMKFLMLVGDPGLVPQTAYARWFLDSLYVMTITAAAYGLWALFRPVVFHFQTHPRERQETRQVVERYGRSAMDYFKFSADKSYFFSASRQSVVAYAVANNFAIVLADPVGPENEIEPIIRDFVARCDENDWGLGFHQTLPDFLSVYEKLGFRRFKLGVVTAGFAEIAAGSIAMGLGGYLAAKTDAEHYHSELQRERRETDELPEQETEEVANVFRSYGLDGESLAAVVSAIRSDRVRWIDFMMRFELGLEPPDPRRARRSALTIALSYIVGGLIPLAPYLFMAQIRTALYASIGVTLAALFTFGYVKGRFTGLSPLSGALRTAAIGGLAAAAAFAIARTIA